MSLVAANVSAPPLNLPALLPAAVSAAETYVASAKAAIAARVAPSGKVDRRLIDVEQHAAHGFAWLATYAETLRQMADWLSRMEAEGKAGETERLLTQFLFAEYLAQLIGGGADEPGRDRPARRFRHHV